MTPNWGTTHVTRPNVPSQPQPTDAWIGQTIDGFRLTDPIGRGAFGLIFRAEADTGDTFAIKLIEFRSAHARDAFAKEKRLSQIDHPNVLKLHDSGTVKHPTDRREFGWLRLDYVEGARTLAEVDFEVERTSKRIAELIDGLRALHDEGLIHRDLHVGNVIVGPKHAVLIDTGLSIETTSGEADMALRGEFGDENFLAEEDRRGGKGPLGFFTDIYSLGRIMRAVFDPQSWRDGRSKGDPRSLNPSWSPMSLPEVPEHARGVLVTIIRQCEAPPPGSGAEFARYATLDELQSHWSMFCSVLESVNADAEADPEGLEGLTRRRVDEALRVPEFLAQVRTSARLDPTDDSTKVADHLLRLRFKDFVSVLFDVHCACSERESRWATSVGEALFELTCGALPSILASVFKISRSRHGFLEFPAESVTILEFITAARAGRPASFRTGFNDEAVGRYTLLMAPLPHRETGIQASTFVDRVRDELVELLSMRPEPRPSDAAISARLFSRRKQKIQYHYAYFKRWQVSEQVILAASAKFQLVEFVELGEETDDQHSIESDLMTMITDHLERRRRKPDTDA